MLNLNLLSARAFSLVATPLVADLLLHVDSLGMTQVMVDSLSDNDIRRLTRDSAEARRLSRWQEHKRLRIVSSACDRPVKPLQDVELTEEQTKLVALARKRLKSGVCEMLSNGYSVSETARELGIDRSTLAHKLAAIRKYAV